VLLDEPGRPIRGIVYGVGAMGKIMARLMLEKGVEIVGAVAKSPEKVGRDLGDVAGLDYETGVIIDDDPERVLSTQPADIAVVALASYLDTMFEHFELCLRHSVNVVTIEEESFYPWKTAPVLAAELDRIAKEHGVTITGSGQQDIYWMNIVSLLMGAAHRVDSVIGQTTWNADDYGPAVAAEVHVGETREEFDRFVADEGWPSFVVRNTLDALVADIGLTTEKAVLSVDPVVLETDRWCKSLGRTIPAGCVVGVVDRATVETREGPTFTFEMAGRIYAEGEVDTNQWVITGEPAELRLFNDCVPTPFTTCAQVVNRIPDVINAPPGFTTVDRLPKLRYRPFPLAHYVV
jgi:4-hydroxy-tetrahydrodipicolinate reductase